MAASAQNVRRSGYGEQPGADARFGVTRPGCTSSTISGRTGERVARRYSLHVGGRGALPSVRIGPGWRWLRIAQAGGLPSVLLIAPHVRETADLKDDDIEALELNRDRSLS